MIENIPPDLKAVAPGIGGSLIALFFLRRPPMVLAGMFLGGVAMSHYGTHFVADYFGMMKYEGSIGFLIGLFSMALVAKVYDTIEAINPGDLWKAVSDAVRAKLGVAKKTGE